MSFHNRILLNRAAVHGLETLEVMLAVAPGQMAAVSEMVGRLGGRVRYEEARVGYLRVDVPAARLVELAADDRIDAYQISSLSMGAWFRDAPPQANAEMFRRQERGALPAPPSVDPHAHLPLLSADEARRTAYTGGEDVGIDAWLAEHPTFDGRGVTIALMESGRAEFRHPTLGAALTLDGRQVPKLAGVLNTLAPEDPDETRVTLDTEIRATSAWHRLGNRTYAVPGPGTYRFGLYTLPSGRNVVHQFGILQDQTTGAIRVDTDGDGDFRDEDAIGDVNEAFDVRVLKLHVPRPSELGFVVARGRVPHTVHVYASLGGHQAMTASVAAGSRSLDGLAHGVATGARVLLVRAYTLSPASLRQYVESYLETIRRPDVDLLCDSHGISTPPGTGSDFMGLIFSRMIAAYDKPILHAAGNDQLVLNSASNLGDVLSVGGSIGPDAWAALFGGGSIPGTHVHPVGAAGPSIDGGLAPDFVAPVHRVSAELLNDMTPRAVPKNAPAWRLPAGYGVSCCTSSSAPYAAGVAALLISAAKQEGLPYTAARLGRAMRAGARFIPGWGAHEQGSGVLDVGAAWRELQHAADSPRIDISAAVVHPLAPYAARGSTGEGVFERDGWHAGMRGRRVITFTRTSGPPGPIDYALSWTGNDGTFAIQPSVSLPLDQAVPVPMTIAARSPGTHSAILDLLDPVTHAMVRRTTATIVASARFDDTDRVLSLAGRVPLMRSRTDHIDVPGGVDAMSIAFTLEQGTALVTLVPSLGLFPAYYLNVHPSPGGTWVPGTYHVTIPTPSPGVWGLKIDNSPAWREPDPARVSTEPVVYSVRVRLLSTRMRCRAQGTDALIVDAVNRGSALHEPVVSTASGTMVSREGTLPPNGMPYLHEIEVPAGATALSLRVRSAAAPRAPLELYLYDCSSGECFNFTFTAPAADAQSALVRHPAPGRWIAAVNSAPFPDAPGRFVLDEILTTHLERHSGTPRGPMPPGAAWTALVPRPVLPSPSNGRTPVVVCEMFDEKTDRGEHIYPWNYLSRDARATLRSVAAGFSVLPFP